MKITQTLALLLLIAGSLPAQDSNEKPQAQITFHVVTDEGKPVPNIEVTVSTFLRRDEGPGADIDQDFKGKTDEKGMTTITYPSLLGDYSYRIDKTPGFYLTTYWEYHFQSVTGNKWQPWNPTIDMVLKPIIKPIPMYARKMGESVPLTIPVVDKPVAFDLIVADWVAPYGKGSISDLVFTFTETIPFVNIRKPFDVTLAISFSNRGDGIQSVLVPIDIGSNLQLPRYAPENGYEPKLVRQLGRPAEGKPINSSHREDQNYFFHVRTIMDEQGNIKSALYGKIDGDIEFWGDRGIRFNYYLNPNANDRNMEFDTTKNLFIGLSPLDEIINP